MGKSPAWFGKRQCIQGIAFNIFQASQIVSGILKMYISDQKQTPLFKKKMQSLLQQQRALYFI